MSCLRPRIFLLRGRRPLERVRQRSDRAGQEEVAQIGLVAADDVVDACVVRQPKAYPVYDEDYRDNVATIRLDLEGSYPTLHLVGRNGMHKYNNQDHAMMTAMLCAQNILAGGQVYDLWKVNQDAEYHEAGKAGDAADDRRDGAAAWCRRGSRKRNRPRSRRETPLATLRISPPLPCNQGRGEKCYGAHNRALPFFRNNSSQSRVMASPIVLASFKSSGVCPQKKPTQPAASLADLSDRTLPAPLTNTTAGTSPRSAPACRRRRSRGASAATHRPSWTTDRGGR